MGVRAHSPGSRGAGGALYASGARAGRVLCPVRHPLFHDFHTNGTGALLRAAPRIEGGAFMFSTLLLQDPLQSCSRGGEESGGHVL